MKHFTHLGPQSRCDLHLHSVRSDGRYTPDEILDEAARKRLGVIALTDHDLSTNMAPGLHRRNGHDVFLIHGAEISGVHNGQEFHLLVYFPYEAPPAFTHFCQQQVTARRKRYEQALANIGLADVDDAATYLEQGTEALTRHHLARALVKAGHAQSLADAFQRFATPQNVPRLGLPFTECIQIARQSGGLTSWAHPPLAQFKAYIQTFAAAGLQGVEAIRPNVNRTSRKTYKKAAKRLGLFLTGGSDWHGWKGTELGLFFIYQRELNPFFQTLWPRAA